MSMHIIDEMKIQEAISDMEVFPAEQSVLGALLTSPVSYRIYSKNSFLQPEHFSNEFHQRIYKAYIDIESEMMADDGQKPIHPLTIKNRLNLGKDDSEYVVKLCGLSAAIVAYSQYAKVIVESYRRRKAFLELVNKLNRYSEYGSEEVASALKQIYDEIESVTPSNRTKKSNEVGVKILESLGKPKKIYSSGIPQLDNAMSGGFVAGKMYGICARKKTGKTVLSGTLAYNLAKSGLETFFIACEMSEEEIQQRVIARDIGKNCGIFLYHDVVKFENEIAESVARDNGKLIYHDGKCITFQQLKIEMNRAVNMLNAKVFILDYIQLVGGRNPKQSEASFMDEVSQWLAEFFLVTETVGIVIAQMNQTGNVRGGEGIRLACSQCYELKKSETFVYDGYNQFNGYYLEMMDTRYTPWIDIGSEEQPALVMDNAGPFFREVQNETKI